jgi:hypothetical protein
VVDKKATLARRNQLQAGIAPAFLSSLEWRAASFELAGVERNPTPTLKLQALVRTAKLIYSEFNKETAIRIASTSNSSSRRSSKCSQRRDSRETSRSLSHGAAAAGQGDNSNPNPNPLLASLWCEVEEESSGGACAAPSPGEGEGEGEGVVTSSAPVVLGADDLLPIFIFVLCRSGLQTPIRNKELLWNLCHPDQLHGESGYYLTLYESAVTFVQDVEL